MVLWILRINTKSLTQWVAMPRYGLILIHKGPYRFPEAFPNIPCPFSMHKQFKRKYKNVEIPEMLKDETNIKN